MYLEYYHLSQKPFQINTDPSFLWLGEKHKEALSTLRYGLYENKSFLVLTGDIGVGKTTVINALLQLFDKKDRIVVIHDPGLEKLDFFNYLADAYGISGNYTSKGKFIRAFAKFLLKCYYRGRRVLLIIDEAQMLTHELLEEIRLFSNLEKNGVKLINIFFVGQMEFNEILLRPENRAIRQRITVNYNIEPLTEKETREYIEFRLSVAGAVRKKIFDRESIREIYRFSKGYPRLINVIADRAMLTGFVRSHRSITKDIVRECVKELDISRATHHYELKNENEAGLKHRKPVLKSIRRGCMVYVALVLLFVFILYWFSNKILPLLPMDDFFLFFSGALSAF